VSSTTLLPLCVSKTNMGLKKKELTTSSFQKKKFTAKLQIVQKSSSKFTSTSKMLLAIFEKKKAELKLRPASLLVKTSYQKELKDSKLCQEKHDDFFKKSAKIKHELSILGSKMETSTTKNQKSHKRERQEIGIVGEDMKVDFGDIDLGKLKLTGEIDTFVGDVSLGERQLLFSLWKLLNKQIGSSDVIQCQTCAKIFPVRSDLLQHLATSCMDLFEEFFSQVEDHFASKLSQVSPEWNIMNTLEFLKEKMLAFMDHRWCLLCGKTTPPTNSGSFLINHMIYAHFKKEFMVYCKPSSSNTKLFQCPLPNKENQSCGLQFKSKSLLFDHLGVHHSLVDQLLKNTIDINTISGTAPIIENGPTGSEFISCSKCGKCFANNISLMIHRANDIKELIQINKESNKIKCGYENCFYTAVFSEEEIVRHFGLVHLDITSNQSTSKAFQSHPAVEDKIAETVIAKKIVEAIYIDDQEAKTFSPQSLFDSSSNRTSILSEKSKAVKRNLGISPTKNDQSAQPQKNCIAWSSISKSPKVAAQSRPSSLRPSSTSLVKKYSSMPVLIDCPVCNAPFTLIPALHEHLSNKHFKNKLTALVSMNNLKEFLCPDSQCSFKHKTKQMVTEHISTNHLLAFDIAKEMFSDFSIPAPTISSSTNSSSFIGKRSFSGIIDQGESKKFKKRMSL